jgi:protein O-GlcNAc transferase
MRLAELGDALHQAGEAEAALVAFELTAAAPSASVNNWHAVTAMRMQLNLPRAALSACHQALAIDPDNADSLCDTAMVLERLGEHDAALQSYGKALAVAPGHYRSLRNLPIAYASLGKYDEAIEAAEKALALYPADPALHFNLGELCLGAMAPARAVVAYRECLALDSHHRFAAYAMSIALAATGRVADAWAMQQAALAETPSLPVEYRSPLRLDEVENRHDVSPDRIAMIAAFDQFRACDWSGYEASIRLFTELIDGLHGAPPMNSKDMAYISLQVSTPMNSAYQQRLARQIATRTTVSAEGIRLSRHSRPARSRIRIGYISSSFHPHPISHLMGDIYVRHDRGQFEIYAYSLGPDSDSPERYRVRDGVDVFRDVARFPPQAAAQLIVNDGIDILVDLSGYTRDTKPEILVRRPAPIQVNYLDFMGTTGASHIDYTMLDRSTLTAADREFWDERIVYLPHCSYHCELPHGVPPTPGNAELGLPDGAIVLGALHHPRKLDPLSVETWLELLQEIPGAILWLLHETNQQVRNLRSLAESKGIAAERLIFSPLLPRQEYLALFRSVRVHLDTFVYNGHTTTTDALGMGTPMVSLTGDTVVARVATSMLKAHGVPELVASNRAAYKALVHRLASDGDWHATIKNRVANPQSGNLFCPERRIREMESAYRMMWERHQLGLPPEDFDVPAWHR